MRFPIGAMSLGDIFARSFQLLFSRLGTLYAIMLLVELPVFALRLSLPDLMLNGPGPLVVLLPTLTLQTIGTGAMIRVIMQEYLDRPVTFGQAFQFALGRFGALLGTSLLSGLCVLLGLLFCLIPGIYLAVVFSLASQVVVVEDWAGMEALSRSKGLVQGYFWRVFGVLFLVWLCGALVSSAVSASAAMALPYQEGVQMFDIIVTVRLSSYPNYALVTTLTTLVQTFFQTYTGICTTLLYFDLRNRKEAFDLELEAEKINTLVERFGDRARPGRLVSESGDTGIQTPEDGVRPAGGAPAPPGTGIQPADPDVPPPGRGPLP